MPITPLKLQRRLTEVGRIRIGAVRTNSNGRSFPSKLDRFRFTSADKSLLDQIAALYGGTVTEWTPANGGAQAWEVITTVDSIPVVVHPQSISQWFEEWSGGGCQRRCDGERMTVAGGKPADQPCMCTDQNMPCKPTTRLSVMLTELESIGVWRLESKGWNAAAELLAQAGAYVKARLFLKPVRQVTDGQTRDFMVPALAMDGVTPAQLLAAGSGGPALGAGSSEAPVTGAAALPAAGRNWRAEAEAATDVETVKDIWRDAKAAGELDEDADLQAFLKARGDALLNKPDADEETEVVEGDLVDEDPSEQAAADAWEACVKEAGRVGLTLTQLRERFAQLHDGEAPDSASVAQLRAFCDDLAELPDAA